MPWKIRITDAAKNDIKDIKKWYKEQSLKAMENFTTKLITSIKSLQKENVEHRSVYGDFRRLFLNKFPYTIYYLRNDKDGAVDKTAVLHNRRDNDVIAKRFYE